MELKQKTQNKTKTKKTPQNIKTSKRCLLWDLFYELIPQVELSHLSRGSQSLSGFLGHPSDCIACFILKQLLSTNPILHCTLLPKDPSSSSTKVGNLAALLTNLVFKTVPQGKSRLKLRWNYYLRIYTFF